MDAPAIDPHKVVFINLSGMKTYQGPEYNITPSGSYVESTGLPHEMFNFKEDNGNYYGFATPHGKLNLSRISKNIKTDNNGKYIDNVLVIFTCPGKQGGRVICGAYFGAKVYADIVNDNRNSRITEAKGENICISYNMICPVDKGLLIGPEERTSRLPRSRDNNAVGHGQHQLCYTDSPEMESITNEKIKYLEGIFLGRTEDDETKYSSRYAEGNLRAVSVARISRSSKAREECLQLKGYVCQICGFDFETTYGLAGKDFIEVHHINPLSETAAGEGYADTDPSKDLIPVCSNCHSVIHRKRPAYSIEEIRNFINNS